MARAHGARAQMALAFETTYGTPPASGYTRMPFASTTLGAEQPLLNSELLGYGGRGAAPSVNVTIMTHDADSFRQSRTQVAADIARAVSLGRRGL